MNIWRRFLTGARVGQWSANLERYDTPAFWDAKYAAGYRLDVVFEACRYGCVSALVAHFANRGPVLDLGCGDGVLTKYIRALTEARIVAVDYSQRAIDEASSRGISNCEFLLGDIRSFFPAEAFSVIVFNESLYYLRDVTGVLRNYTRHLTPEGVFVISMVTKPKTRMAWRHVRRFGGSVLHDNIIDDQKIRHQFRVQVIRPGNQC